jgi:hypothetical protein
MLDPLRNSDSTHPHFWRREGAHLCYRLITAIDLELLVLSRRQLKYSEWYQSVQLFFVMVLTKTHWLRGNDASCNKPLLCRLLLPFHTAPAANKAIARTIPAMMRRTLIMRSRFMRVLLISSKPRQPRAFRQFTPIRVAEVVPVVSTRRFPSVSYCLKSKLPEKEFP